MLWDCCMLLKSKTKTSNSSDCVALIVKNAKRRRMVVYSALKASASCFKDDKNSIYL